MTDEIFELYRNYTEPYYERHDLSLISLSNSLVSYDDNPIEKPISLLLTNFKIYLNGFDGLYHL